MTNPEFTASPATGTSAAAKARAHYRPALLAAAGVAIILLAQFIASIVISIGSFVRSSAVGESYYGDISSMIGQWTTSGAQMILATILPTAIGVALVFLLLLPLVASLSVAQVLLRSVVASAGGAAAVFVVGVVLALFQGVRSLGPLFGNSFPGFDTSGEVLWGIGSAIDGALYQLFTTIPVVALVAVLVWLWLRRGPAYATLVT